MGYRVKLAALMMNREEGTPFWMADQQGFEKPVHHQRHQFVSKLDTNFWPQ